MSTDNQSDGVDLTERIAEADISASTDAQVAAEVARIEARTEHATLRFREEEVADRGGDPEASAFCYQGDARATLSIYMGLDRSSYASAGLDAEGCRDLAAQLLRAAEELDRATDGPEGYLTE